jgi:hypothetical protein
MVFLTGIPVICADVGREAILTNTSEENWILESIINSS